MGYIETLATERKARLARLGRPVFVAPPWKGIDPAPWWPAMWMGDLVFGKPRGDVNFLSIREIQEKVAEHFGLSVRQLLSENRTALISHPRQIAMYLCRELSKHAVTMIGRHFGGRDHTTVIHACQKIQLLIGKSEGVALDVKVIKLRLGIE